MFSDREVVWSLAVGLSAHEGWTERSVLLAMNAGLQHAGGRVYRSGPYSLTGGIPGGVGFADSRPSGIAWTSSDAMWALVRGDTDPTWKRQRLVSDVQTAHRLALHAMVPSWATEPAAEPSLPVEKQTWSRIESGCLSQDLEPHVATWMFEHNYIRRDMPETQQDKETISITDVGVERLKRVRAMRV
jgi:hypothetical protein